jgi:hypothetical protein
MVRQFTYTAAGRLLSRAVFETELLVVAETETEAEDEAIACLESFESVADWSIKPAGTKPADEHEVARYHEHGAFSVFDPVILVDGARHQE